MVDISNSLWNEQDNSNTASNPNGWPSGSFFNAIEPTMRATMGAIKRFWDRANSVYTSTGSSGTYVITPSNTSYPTAYIQGETWSFKAHQVSAGNDTFQISNTASLSAINIYKPTSAGIVQIAANDIQTGAHIVGQIDTALNGGAGGFFITGGLIPPTAGVSSFTGDGTLLSNSSSTGAVTATLENASANKVLAGPTSGTAAAPTFRAIGSSDLPLGSSSQVGAVQVDNSTITANGSGVISSKPIMTALGVGSIVLGCSSTVQASLTAGTSYAGSALLCVNFLCGLSNATVDGAATSNSLSGTWVALTSTGSGASAYWITLLQRIA